MFGVRMMMVSVAMNESTQAGGDSFGIILVVKCGCISLCWDSLEERRGE